MFKKNVLIFLLCVVCLYPLYSTADFSLYWRDNNYFLFEGRGYQTLDFSKDLSLTHVANERFYSTFKLRMKPSLGITDRLSIHSTFDAFASPHVTKTQEGGAVSGEQANDTTNYGPNVGGGIPTNILGNSAFGHSNITTGDSNFLIRAAFLEYIGDWGILRMGRQPRHWGLGIRYNSGENPFDKFSDRTDTLSYELGLGNFKAAALISKILENNIDSGKDDASLYETYLYWNDPEKDLDVGILYSFLFQKSTFITLNTLDVFFKKKSKKWRIGVEGVNTIGNPGNQKDNDAFQVGIASEVGFDWTANLYTYLKAGYASGPELNRQGKLTLFAFDRNYDIALIMFNQGVGDIPAQTGVSVTSEPDLNTIFGAYYLNLGGNYKFNDRFGTNLNYVIAQAPRHFVAGGNKDYGQEFDLSAWFQFVENMKVKVDAGAFFPGMLYRGAPAINPPKPTDSSFALLCSTLLVF